MGRRLRERRFAGRLALCAALLLLPAFALPALAAGGPGDGTTTASWMEDERMLPALSAVREKNYSRAIELLKAVVADRPDFADAWNYLAFSLRKSGALDQSEKAYRTALRLDPEHRGAHEYLGELYLQTGRRSEAEVLERGLSRICRYGCPELEELRAALRETLGEEGQ